VAASGRVDRDLLRYAKELLEKVGANIVGVVLNRVPRSNKGKYYYYYYSDDQDKTGERKVRKYK
jgi:Mrp family chromosome partitioning ATPase